MNPLKCTVVTMDSANVQVLVKWLDLCKESQVMLEFSFFIFLLFFNDSLSHTKFTKPILSFLLKL